MLDAFEVPQHASEPAESLRSSESLGVETTKLRRKQLSVLALARLAPSVYWLRVEREWEPKSSQTMVGRWSAREEVGRQASRQTENGFTVTGWWDGATL